VASAIRRTTDLLLQEASIGSQPQCARTYCCYWYLYWLFLTHCTGCSSIVQQCSFPSRWCLASRCGIATPVYLLARPSEGHFVFCGYFAAGPLSGGGGANAVGALLRLFRVNRLDAQHSIVLRVFGVGDDVHVV
jgi:hypothetical protein